jgi:hypothetical protein
VADALFSTLQRFQGAAPWGSVLDAGTGDHSLRWLLSCNPRRLDAITGDEARQRSMTARFAPELRPQDRLIAGNWTDPLLLHGEVYDQVLADYLLGAIDGFAPYFQDRLFARLRPHVGQRLYVVGLAPYPEPGDDPGGQLIWEIARLRDAAILLAGHRCYREYPLDWCIRHLESSGFRVEEALAMPIVYRERFINGQLDVVLSKLPLLADPGLAAALRAHVAELRQRALDRCARTGGISFGEDYVIAAKPV